MRGGDRHGFTLVEVVMAIVILAFGILVLSSSAAGISRMLGSGQGKTRAAAIASARLEYLRNVALTTTPPCGSGLLAGGTALPPGGGGRLLRGVDGDRGGTEPAGGGHRALSQRAAAAGRHARRRHSVLSR